MAYVLKERDKSTNELAPVFLVILTIVFGAPLIFWAKNGCFQPGLRSVPMCGTVGTSIAALFAGLLISFWIAFLKSPKPKWANYDPDWLIRLAEKELPDDKVLAGALASCRKVARFGWTSKTFYFVDPSQANMPSTSWQFKEAIVFETYEKGPVILDLLQDGRIGSVECTWMVPFPINRRF